MGRGRHALLLARLGFRVFGVDRRLDSVSEAVHAARDRRLTVLGWCADLTAAGLPRERFDLVVVAKYLQRDLFHDLSRALLPGGVLLYETFTRQQRTHRRGPTSDAHLLRPGELREAFRELDQLFYEEIEGSDALARLVARRRS
jgi:SAM-dependent methyltransferase